MSSFAELLQQGPAHAWLYFPSAILLGTLHGLEPGHSKTMMAAFIVAVRGTVKQAVLLGLAATVSHTAVVWLVALGGMYLGRNLDAEASEPYFQLASAVIIVTIALWMLWRTWRGEQMWRLEQEDQYRQAATRRLDTGHGGVELSIFQNGQPPHWRLQVLSGHAWQAAEVSLQTTRADGRMRRFAFVDRGGYLESVEEVPQPHQFTVRLSLGHAGHSHDYDLDFHGPGQDRTPAEPQGLELSPDDYRDAHERAHASDIQRRFANRNVTTGQIVLFGLTGGLIPCPAAITVLLLCLQVQAITLGAVLVLCFSLGLALTLVSVGAAAVVGARQAANRWPWLGGFARRAPYLSSLLIVGVGLYVGAQGWVGLSARIG
ncbi:nickel/cobalt efflux protein RcnA [Pseudomonas sp. BN417]|uniref:nickel/cobalt efflux protein RcnA n=1 Tax=Pseudomonas sp. BN417 TaxID=2567890 RepID=UPI0024590439|nr:nickel/cobalt efflux protein RcnA [Pseudomonas sp. BN417]MDH4559000.1 nickel/cobalt efflux protein RcnA [Pseudomonas sp. BN417]